MTQKPSPEKMISVLEEIAYGEEWGGPAEDHVAYMRAIAVQVLEDNTTTCVLGTDDEVAANKKRDTLADIRKIESD